MQIDWLISKFKELSAGQLYEILALRQAVFIVEQNCPYLDADGLDHIAIHFSGWYHNALLTYARMLPPESRFKEPSIGRIVTHQHWRNRGLATRLIQSVIRFTRETYPGQPIAISAQVHLQSYYEKFGFTPDGKPYLEDNIPHVKMLYKP